MRRPGVPARGLRSGGRHHEVQLAGRKGRGHCHEHVAHEGNSLSFERHEEADNSFYAFYRVYAEVAVVDFPLEHWDEDSTREVLAALGNVWCLDPTCFSGGDYTSIRAVLCLDHHREIPEQLLVRNHNEPACLSTVYLICTWLDAGPEPDREVYDFGNGPELHTAPRYHPVGNPPTQLPPAPQNLVATILEWENIITPTPPSGSHQAGDPVPEAPGGHLIPGSVPPMVRHRRGFGAATVHSGKRREHGDYKRG
jgi:hypothetical protein